MPDTTLAPTQTAANEDSKTSGHGSHIWYELLTPDPVAAKTFYDAVIGWNIEAQPSGAMDYRMIGRTDGGNSGGVMRLTDEMRGHGARPIWLGYVAVDDVDESVASVEQAGGKALMPAFDIPDIGRIALVTDPQGNPFYVMKPIPPAGSDKQDSDVFSTTEVQHFSWNELSTTDPVAARVFYGELFGWTSDEFMPMGDYGEYRFLAHKGTTIGAVCGCVEGASAGWRYYVSVPSISKAVEAVKAGGGTIAVEPHEVPGGDHIIIGHDPQGAEFALVGKL